MRWNRVLPATLLSLQNKLMFWRRVPLAQWDWMTLLFLAILIWVLYRALTGHVGVLVGFVLASIAKDIHNDALPIFARVRIRGDKLTLGTIFTERHSLKEMAHYSVSREELPQHTVRFSLSERYWPSRFSFVVDEEDEFRLIEFLQARGIGDRIAYLEQLSGAELEAVSRDFVAAARAQLR